MGEATIIIIFAAFLFGVIMGLCLGKANKWGVRRMNNAEKFKQIFGLYATELWSMPESDFLEWLNRDVETTQIDHTAESGRKVSISCGQENDLISRQAAIDALHMHLMYRMGTDSNKKRLDDWINGVPSAQPEQRWIPCSERLPEDYQDVLVWFEYYRYGSYNRMYSTHGIGAYSKRYDSWMINHESGWKDLHVIAWMPLPEPYKGGEQDG